MYVCVCKAVTDREIQSCIREGATSLERLQEQLGVGTRCGRCRCDLERIMDEHCLFCPEDCRAAA